MITFLAFKSERSLERAEHDVEVLQPILKEHVPGYELVQAVVMEEKDFNRDVEDEIRKLADEAISKQRGTH